MEDTTCLEHLFGGSGLMPCALGRCRNCSSGVNYCSMHYCSSCAKTLKKCKYCGSDIKYSKQEFINIMEQLKDYAKQSDYYQEFHLDRIDAVLSLADSFTSASEPYAIWTEKTKIFNGQRKKAEEERVKKAEEEWTRRRKFVDAARSGNIDLVRELTETNYEEALEEALVEAAEGGQIDIVVFLLEKISKDCKEYFNTAMYSAVRNNHLDIIKLLVQKGADNFNEVMADAALFGHLPIVKLMLELGATNYNEAMREASRNGNLEIIQLLLKNGANDYNNALSAAVTKSQGEVVKLMLKLGADNSKELMKTTKNEDIIARLTEKINAE